jgi:hypothetical protein
MWNEGAGGRTSESRTSLEPMLQLEVHRDSTISLPSISTSTITSSECMVVRLLATTKARHARTLFLRSAPRGSNIISVQSPSKVLCAQSEVSEDEGETEVLYPGFFQHFTL